jgi:hypothetical protein
MMPRSYWSPHLRNVHQLLLWNGESIWWRTSWNISYLTVVVGLNQCCAVIWFKKNNRQFQFCKIFRIKEPLVVIFWVKKSKLKNHWWWVFQKRQRIHGFHKRTGKEPMVRKVGSCLQIANNMEVCWE